MQGNSGVNKVILVGHITNDEFVTDAEYAAVTLVTTELIKKGEEITTHYEYHKIRIPLKLMSLNNLQLEAAQCLYVEGKIHTSSFVDSMQVKRYDLEIVVSKVEIFSYAVSETIK